MGILAQQDESGLASPISKERSTHAHLYSYVHIKHVGLIT